MLRSEELVRPDSCFNKAHDEEMIFVLLARDIAAPTAIIAWVNERIRLGKNVMEDDQIQEALACAGRMGGQK